MPPPLVTALLTCHNRRGYLLAALRSVERQTHRPLEAVVVDDGSTDGTARAVVRRRWAVPVRVLRLPVNRGPAAARRRGVEAARGEWVAFLDSDDLWLPRKLEEQLRRAAPGVQFVYSDFHEISPRGRPLRRNSLMHRRGSLFFARLARSLWRLPFFPVTSTVMMRRDLITRLGSFDPHFRYVADDPDLWLRALIRVGARGTRCLTEALSLYRRHPGQTAALLIKPSQMHLLPRLSPPEREKVLDHLYFMFIKHGAFLKKNGLDPNDFTGPEGRR